MPAAQINYDETRTFANELTAADVDGGNDVGNLVEMVTRKENPNALRIAAAA